MDFSRCHKLGDNGAGRDDSVRDEAQPDMLLAPANQLARPQRTLEREQTEREETALRPKGARGGQRIAVYGMVPVRIVLQSASVTSQHVTDESNRLRSGFNRISRQTVVFPSMPKRKRFGPWRWSTTPS